MYKNIAIIGSTGAIGEALTAEFINTYPEAVIYTFAKNPKSHRQAIVIDYLDEQKIQHALKQVPDEVTFDFVIIAIGVLHQTSVKPEKSLKEINQYQLEQVFKANTIAPTLLAKHFAPRLNKHSRSVLAALSARVGSISDNRLGGWYAYRASKAALNMIIKNLSIELKRTHKQSIVVGLHPGTVDSALSKPYQTRVPEHQLFSPSRSAKYLHQVLNHLTIEDTGHILDWAGKEIAP